MLAVARSRGGSPEAATVAAVVCVLVTLDGGDLLSPIAGWGPVAAVVLAGITYMVVDRLAAGFNLRWMLWAVAVGLLVFNGFNLLRLLAAESTGTEQEEVAEAPAHQASESSPDVVVLILDEFASPETTPLEPVDWERLLALTQSGYEMSPLIWSPYSISAAAIAAILDGGYPLKDGEVLNEATIRRLGAITRGDSRLVETLKARGYRFTMIEGGLWLSSCGPEVDHCERSHPIDEAMGVLLRRSAFRWWYERLWGDAFAATGMHSMSRTRRVVMDAAINDRADLVFSHVMLPHIPYVLDRECRLHGLVHADYTTPDQRLAGYQRQAGCVVEWLVETLSDLDEVTAGPPPIVVVLGDHGTNFGGQVLRPVRDWTVDDVRERLGTFVTYRLPEDCRPRGADTIAQLTDTLIACVSGVPASLDASYFLVSYGDDPPTARQIPSVGSGSQESG
ncbi:MAG: hypothetical protein ACLFWM_08965 [Actinomycetota bacterium]